MRLLGYITVYNRTDLTWTFCIYGRSKFNVEPREDKTEFYFFPGKSSLIVKFGNCTEKQCVAKPDFICDFDLNDDPKFTIQEIKDRQEIQLSCNPTLTMTKSTCPNYGRK